jgi:hypothetical protein
MAAAGADQKRSCNPLTVAHTVTRHRNHHGEGAAFALPANGRSGRLDPIKDRFGAQLAKTAFDADAVCLVRTQFQQLITMALPMVRISGSRSLP